MEFPPSLRNVEDLAHERPIGISHAIVRFWRNRCCTIFPAEFRAKCVEAMRAHGHWQRHLEEVVVKINGETRHLRLAVDQEGEALDRVAIKRRDRKAASKFVIKTVKRHGRRYVFDTDKLRS